MPQKIILALGQGAALSDAFTVVAGSTATVGIFAASRSEKAANTYALLLATPGAPNCIDYLTDSKRQVVVGPGTYQVQRGANAGASFGVFVEQ